MKFHKSYETRNFVTAFTIVRHFVFVLEQKNTFHANPLYFLYVHFKMLFCPRLVLQTGSPSHQKPVCDSIQNMRATCPTHLIFIGLTVIKITDDCYKS